MNEPLGCLIAVEQCRGGGWPLNESGGGEHDVVGTHVAVVVSLSVVMQNKQ